MEINKIVITEPTELENTKSVGCYFIESVVRDAGYSIEYVDFEKIASVDADIILFSVHHVKDIFYLTRIIEKKNALWIGGGHVMNNPYPFLHFFDLICVGEGEDWVMETLKLYENSLTIDEFLSGATGNIPGSLTRKNIDEKILKRYADDISQSGAYLNKSNAKGHRDTWYLEIARGCKSKCAYCELGWTNFYREHKKEKIMNEIEKISESSPVKRVNIFAPDDFSVSFYEDCLDLILQKKLVTNFGSMRSERLQSMKKNHKKNFLFRIGLDGMSERIRKIIGKPKKNDDIVKMFSQMTADGFVMFKIFMIFSYPFEREQDFAEFNNLFSRLKNAVQHLTRPVFLRVKFTPFIPNLYTPFEDFQPNYDKNMREKIEMFFLHEKMNRSNIVLINDGIMEPFSYYTQALVSRARFEDVSVDLLRNRKKLNFVSDNLLKKIQPLKNIEMRVSRESLERAKNSLNNRIEKYAI